MASRREEGGDTKVQLGLVRKGGGEMEVQMGLVGRKKVEKQRSKWD